MMPIVFCASLPPWPSEYRPAEISCRRRNQLSTRKGELRRQIHETDTIISEARKKPSSGETKMNATVLNTPPPISWLAPALAITAPTMPPISACDELDGMPYHQVS